MHWDIMKFLIYLEAERNASSHTLKNYHLDLKEFEKFLEGQISFSTVTPLVIRKWIVSLHKRKYSKATIARKLACLRSFFRYMKRSKRYPIDPTSGIYNPKREKKLPVFLNIDEVLELINAPLSEKNKLISLRDYAILMLLYVGGLRVSELVNLEEEDVDILRSLVKVKQGKGMRTRIVPINIKTSWAIKNYLSERKSRGEGGIFLSKNERELSARDIQRIVDKYIKKVGIQKKISPHSLRHSFATHQSIATTQIYTHLTKKRRVCN